MIVGGGAAANIIIKEIKTSRYTNHKNIKCIIDDAPEKQGMYIHGIRVVGNRDNIIEMVVRNDINEIIIAMPSATRKAVAEIVSICKETGCELRILPGIYQLMNGEVSVKKLRKVDIEDLLGRDTIKADMNSIASYVKDKVVLVTGGGGSIGSELCRQLATQEPKQLIILDIYENNAYAIQQELIRKYPNLNLLILISSVRDAIGLKQIFKKYQPDIVYHAAAHKHVPLMEDSPKEAIKNNVLGTLNAVVAAHLSGVQRFVMISTDKAVNPTNVMGASKRICEMIIQAYNKRSDTEFVAVRFGNVLGSNGSVIPLFRQQIEAGGPVTVTHPDIIRYFMTIPEAVTLVLQAGAYAKGGEIFVLDMGEPVKILDLAINLIRLSGYEPYEEISIEFTGLRPGEKLYEEMLMDEEGMTSTENHMIFIGKPINFDESRFFQQIEELKVASHTETSDIRKLIKEIVPGYMDGDTNENKLKDFLIQSNKDRCLIN
jgi:Predicted nucleoside-diphosphate sugar epimerases